MSMEFPRSSCNVWQVRVVCGGDHHGVCGCKLSLLWLALRIRGE